MHSQQPRIIVRVTARLILSVVGCTIAAAGMILSEHSNSYAAMTRVAIAGITGVILVPLFVATTWRKPLARATMVIFLPPTIAGLICLMEFEPDYGYFKLVVPLVFASCLVATLGLQEVRRESNVNLCAACGYDLRGSASPRCPECGWDRALPVSRRPLALVRLIPIVVWLAAATISGFIAWLFLSWFMSLG